MGDRYHSKRKAAKLPNYRGRNARRGPRILLLLLLALVLVGLIIFGALLGTVLAGDRDDLRGDPQVMIILGCQVKPWGPSILLQDRLDKALGYWEDHPDITIVASGGQGADEHISEAQCIRDYLVEGGVPQGQILLEDQSHNTLQNLRYSKELLTEQGRDAAQDVVVVSNGFHLARVRMLWGRVWGETGQLSTLAAPSSHAPSRLMMYLREPLALAKSFLLDK